MSEKNDNRDRLMRHLKEAHTRYTTELLQIPGVHGVGIGFKEVGGKRTEEIVLIVRVDKKQPRERIDPKELIPRELVFYSEFAEDEVRVETDVQERRRPVTYPHIADGDLENRVRPIPGGYSIGEHLGSGGTLGGWVWDNVTEQTVLLSNNHVLGATAGSDVTQPSEGDGATWPADHFADVVRTGTLDATIAAPADGDDISLSIEGIGPAVYEVAEATLGMQVEKSGQTTEHTRGTVTMVSYASYHYGSTNDFEVTTDTPGTRFAYYGDSGSLIVERNHPEDQSWKRVVGLLWGGDPNEENAYAHQIEDVFEDLDLTTVCAGVIEAIVSEFFSEYAESTVPERIVAAPLSHVMKRRRFFHGIGRDFERQLMQSPAGREIVDAIHTDRVAIVNFLRNREGLRALAAIAGPLLKNAVTTDDLLERRITKDDLQRVERALKIAERTEPDMRRSLRLADKLLHEAEGGSLHRILKGK
ncbi:MAG: hypothetical protein R3300_17630 [Candidatus Promineifilaceae bacterium]|nr:hypothetical protein [Candidatus Promineifilaceae bacterium]